MSDVSSAYSNYVRFRLTATNVDSFILNGEPIGWKDDDLELDRHKDYHGIFTNFTNKLEFIGESKDYIDRAYKVGGINTDLILTKEITVDDGDDVVWKTRYTALADFSTMSKTATKLNIKFNSNKLAELIKSHESDEFEIENNDPNIALKSIDDVKLEDLVLDKTQIKGRKIAQRGESVLNPLYNSVTIFSGGTVDLGSAQPFNILYPGIKQTVLTDIVSRGTDRHASVDVNIVGDELEKASNMFYVDQTGLYAPGVSTPKLEVTYDLDFDLKSRYFSDISWTDNVSVRFERFRWTGSQWNVVNVYSVETFVATTQWTNFNIKGTIEFLNIGFDEGIMITFEAQNDGASVNILLNKHTLVLSEETRAEPSPNLDFIFTHDLFNRLMSIITSKNDTFYSKYFGRTDLGYAEDGEGGLMGIISGFWIRAFNRESEKYKSLKISTKDLIDSVKAVFNVGIGIETVNLKERLRIEDLKYFYQNEVAVKLPFQIKNEKRTVDNTLFFSGMTFGYDKSGDYEDSMGLDEPNTKTEYITPIRKSTKKLKRTSKVRADEYGLELARRKPQASFPDEDTRYDDNNWFLDLKRIDGAIGYEQRENITDPILDTNRLKEQASGIFSPETFRSSFFTPLRMLMRHAWVFRAGMEVYLDKKIKYISKDKNSTLETHATNDWNKGKDKSYVENDDVLVGDLERSRFLSEIVEFEHPVDDDLMEWINGTTTMVIGGSEEEVPNMYFKFEYTNENGILERGYLLNLKPNKEGKWKMQLSNENLII